jgi:hypothetical protein
LALENLNFFIWHQVEISFRKWHYRPFGISGGATLGATWGSRPSYRLVRFGASSVFFRSSFMAGDVYECRRDIASVRGQERHKKKVAATNLAVCWACLIGPQPSGRDPCGYAPWAKVHCPRRQAKAREPLPSRSVLVLPCLYEFGL